MPAVPATSLRPQEGTVVEQHRRKHWAAVAAEDEPSCSPMTFLQQLSPSDVDIDRSVSGRASLLR